MPIESADSVRAISRRDFPTADQSAETSCAGCRQLTARVERLEQQLLSSQSDRTAVPRLATTSCYWICIVVHAVCIFLLYSSPYLIQLGMVAMIGALATVTVCHAFSTLAIPGKILRTLLSCSIVIASALIAMSLQEILDVSEFMPFVLVYTPFFFASGWFVAKLFVWVRGWKIVPPGRETAAPKLQIWHLLTCTSFAALYLAVTRFMVDDWTDLVAPESISVMLYVDLSVMIAALLSCLLARIILSHRGERMGRNLVLFAVAVFGLSVTAYGVVAVLSGLDFTDADTILGLTVYFVLAVLGLLASSTFTFVMLRLAKYRMCHP